MNANSECRKDDSAEFAQEIIKKTKGNPEMKEMKKEFDNMQCDFPPPNSQLGGGYTLTPEQQVFVLAWAGRLYAIARSSGYLYNIVDAYSLQCAVPHWLAGYFGLGDAGYCASKTALLQATTVQLSILITKWIAGEGVKAIITPPSGGKRKSRRKTRKSKKTRKGKKGKKGRKSRRKH